MHQEHNIPWPLLSKHIKFVREHKGYTPSETGFYAKNPAPSSSSASAGTERGSPSQMGKDLNHFMRSLISTIRMFSETERAKYPSRESILAQKSSEEGKVIYSDELKTLYPEFLDDERQKIECWIERSHRAEGGSQKGTYSTAHGDLADIVKILFLPSSFHASTITTSSTSSSLSPVPPASKSSSTSSTSAQPESEPLPKKPKTKTRSPAEPNLETLLMLANHPSITLGALHSLSWGHHFGWSRVMESALRAYLLLNLIFALSSDSDKTHEDLMVKGGYREVGSYKRMIRDETWGMDFPAQQIPHQRFWKGCRDIEVAFSAAAPSSLESSSSKPIGASGDDDGIPLMHLDMSHLDEYLKLNFALLYKYDMVLRECGREPEWENEVTGLMGLWVKGVEMEYGQWMEDQGKWTAPYFI
ncbi:hypothetical protein MD484_g7637, partial [Candolleomyces efflorescens]